MRLLTPALVLALLVTPAAAQGGAPGGEGPRDRAAKRTALKAKKQNRGVVKSFAGGVLTIDRRHGGDRRALVTKRTRIKCHEAGARRGARKLRGRGSLVGAASFDEDDGDFGGDEDFADDEDFWPDDDFDDDEDFGDDEDFEDDGDFGDSDDDDFDEESKDLREGEQKRAGKRGCSRAKLRRGTRVRRAQVRRTPRGLVFTKIQLAG